MVQSRKGTQKPASSAKQLASFVAKFDPAYARLIRSVRSGLRKLLPNAIEQVYDNYNFLAIGYCTSERTSDCVVSIAASSNGVSLSFYNGASLPDPEHLLLGSGKQNRFVRLENAKALDRPAIKSLIRAAVDQSVTPMPKAGGGLTIIKSVSAKQRPRRSATPKR